jgi:hypothetical protein
MNIIIIIIIITTTTTTAAAAAAANYTFVDYVIIGIVSGIQQKIKSL